MNLINNKSLLNISAKRKTSVVFLKIFSNKNLNKNLIFINNKLLNDYFKPIESKLIILNIPLNLINSNFIIYGTINGGGLVSQLDALKLALAKMCNYFNLHLKSTLKLFKLLKSDTRIKECKKYGLKKARKASQYSKR